VSAAAALEQLWALRGPKLIDEPGLVFLWLESHWRSHYARGRYQCTAGCRRCCDGSTLGDDVRRCQLRQTYWDAHAPRVRRLLASHNVVVACDAKDPETMWGFACFGEGAIHYALVKRRFQLDGFGAEILAAMLHPVLDKPCVLSHELPDTRRMGFKVPEAWKLDPYSIGDV
jgi:hypothetical protein